ncbi:hypothetical protein G7Y89_g4648 [Cudoniella acicularis]|uniref:Zn(2)-C6 fungal-type domain-containing protein n=1 Tax=Cudoniella acicularis TaxID=354080 RepID=A0A8H4W788_9HELO|nr:hypothetical protein G7Y89_g4648 [Cudoniella acicularis]
MCRKRRKKCDEVKPVCSDCSKHSFKCVWPAPPIATNQTLREDGGGRKALAVVQARQIEYKDSASPSPFSDDSTKIGTARSAVYGLPGIRTSIEHYLSLCFKDKFMPTLLRGHAHPGFSHYDPLFGMGAETSTLMEIFLATTAMHTSYTDPKFKTVAVKYYNSVVSSVRKAIQSADVDGNEDWLLLTTNFLCIFEVFKERHITRRTGVVTHLEGFARMLSIRIANDKRRTEKQERPFNRTASESLVYHLCTQSLYDSEVDRIADLFDWNDLSAYLNYEVFAGATMYQNSPLLACNWEIYRCCIEVTRLSHHTPLDPIDNSRGQSLELDLYQFHDDLRNDMQVNRNDPCALDCIVQAQIYVIAAQILIFKTLRPETSTCHPRIRQLVRQGVAIADGLKIDMSCSMYFCWPLAIISCSVETEDDVVILRRVLRQILENSNCGEVFRLRQATESFWKVCKVGKSEDARGTDGEKDILDILLCSEGIFNHPYLKL